MLRAFDDEELLPDGDAPLPVLANMAVHSYVHLTAQIVSPAVYVGVLPYESFEAKVAATMADVSVDAANPPVHVAIVESWPAQATGHMFVAAWQMSLQYAATMTRPLGAVSSNLPPGMGAAWPYDPSADVDSENDAEGS